MQKNGKKGVGRVAKGQLSKEAIARLRPKADKPEEAPSEPVRKVTLTQPETQPDALPFTPGENLPPAVQELWTQMDEQQQPASAPPAEEPKPAKRRGRKSKKSDEKPAEVSSDTGPAPAQPDVQPPEEYDGSQTFTEGVSPARSRRAQYLNYYLYNTLSGLDNTQVLELLLQFAVPYRNTEPIAAELLSRFGGLPGVLGAGTDKLQQVDGVSKEAAALLDMVMRVARRSVEEQNSPGDLLNSDDKVGKFLVGKFFGMTNEALYLLCLDNACRLISCTLLSEGSSSIARLELRKVIGTALQCNAPTVILAHNHPGGRAYPSDEDIRATTRLQGILRLMDINLVDHFIVAGEKWKSMARMGELSVTRTTIL